MSSKKYEQTDDGRETTAEQPEQATAGGAAPTRATLTQNVEIPEMTSLNSQGDEDPFCAPLPFTKTKIQDVLEEEQDTNAASDYLLKHNLVEMTQEWVKKLSESRPEQPLEEMVKMIQSKIEESQQFLTCENPWCETQVRMIEYMDHLSICSPQRWHKCIRCDERVDNDKAEQHRRNCTLVSCSHCGEYVFRRMLPLCPHLLVQQPKLSPQVTPSNLLASPLGGGVGGLGASGRQGTFTPRDNNIKRLQSLWRTFHARTQFQNLAFRLVWDRIEFARETKLATGVSSSERFRYASWSGRRSSSLHLNKIGGAGLNSGREGSLKDLNSTSSPGRVLSPTPDGLRVLDVSTSPIIGDDQVTLGGCSSSSRMGRSGSVGSFSASREMKPEEQLLWDVQNQHPVDSLRSTIDLVGRGKQIDDAEVEVVVKNATKILRQRPTVCPVATPFGGEVVVVGDLHGQLKDLLHILDTEGLPNEHKCFVFNGDFVDRGPNGCEVLFLLYALLCTFPQHVFLTRGNHEDRNTNREYGFYNEVATKYEECDDLFDNIVKSYKVMPLVHLLDERVFIVHGGLPRTVVPLTRLNSLGHVRDIPCVEQQDEDDELVVDLTWSDPVERFKSRALGMRQSGSNWRHSSRGCGVEYTSSHTDEFLKLNKLQYVVRSHEMVHGGYQVMHEGKSITIFSASDYCGVSQNRGAILSFSYGMKEPQFRTWFLKEGIRKKRGLHDSSDLMPMSVSEYEAEGFACKVAMGDEEEVEGGDQKGIDLKGEEVEQPTLQGLIGLEKKDCLIQIQEIVWNNRYRLMSSFSAADVTQVGYVTKVEWSEVMRRVSGLPLPWYFLCSYLTDVVLFQQIPAVNYTKFLLSIDSKCGAKFRAEWVKVKVFDIFKNLNLPEDFEQQGRSQMDIRRESMGDFVKETKGGKGQPKPSPRGTTILPSMAGSSRGRPPDMCGSVRGEGPQALLGLGGLQSAFTTGTPRGRSPHGVQDWTSLMIDFNTFVTTIRAKARSASAIQDNEIVVLFAFFDSDRDGQVNLGELVDQVEELIDEMDDEDTLVMVDDVDDIVKKGVDHTTLPTPSILQPAMPNKPVPKKKQGWIYESMMLLQQFFLYGQRRGLEQIFNTLDREGTGILRFDDFKRLWRRLNKQLQVPLTEEQLEEMFLLVDRGGSGGIEIDEFVSYFKVRDMRGKSGKTIKSLSETHTPRSRRASASGFITTPTLPPPIFPPSSAAAPLSATVGNSRGEDEEVKPPAVPPPKLEKNLSDGGNSDSDGDTPVGAMVRKNSGVVGRLRGHVDEGASQSTDRQLSKS